MAYLAVLDRIPVFLAPFTVLLRVRDHEVFECLWVTLWADIGNGAPAWARGDTGFLALSLLLGPLTRTRLAISVPELLCQTYCLVCTDILTLVRVPVFAVGLLFCWHILTSTLHSL